MSWEFNDVPVYHYQFGMEDYPLGEKKYSVAKDGLTFTLTVKDLDHSDGGEYKCLVGEVSHKAVLLVLDTPEVFVFIPTAARDNTVKFHCTAEFGGPSHEAISPRQYPRLRMFLDDVPLNTSTKEQNLMPGNSTKFYNLTQVRHMKFEASCLDGKTFTCILETLIPAKHVNKTTEINVPYFVHDINYTPRSDYYEVGSIINCTAKGNPEPHFLWNNTEGKIIHGQSLEITEQMVGKNTWECTATNTINGLDKQKVIMVVFEVVLPVRERPADTDIWKIAVGVTVPVCLAIGTLIALYCYYRKHKKKYHLVPSEAGKETGEGTELTELHENDVPFKMSTIWINPQENINYQIELNRVFLQISSKSVAQPVEILVKEKHTTKTRQHQIESTGLDNFLKPVMQLSLQPLGLKMLRTASVKVNYKKLTRYDNFFVFNRCPDLGEDLWTDMTASCNLRVKDDGVSFKIKRFSEIEVFCSTIDAGQVSAILNNRFAPCNFFVYYKPLESMLKSFVETQDQNNQNPRHEEPLGSECVGIGASKGSVIDQTMLKFYYDSSRDLAGEYQLNLQKCKDQSQYINLPVNATSIKELPDCISIRQTKANEEEEISIICVVKNNSKYGKLSEIIRLLNSWSDLDVDTSQKLEELLNEDNGHMPIKGPSALVMLIQKSGILIQSKHFTTVIKSAISNHLKGLRGKQEDPLLCLVKLLEKPGASSLTQHHEKLLNLIKVLLQFHSSSDTRNRCIRLLIKETTEWRRCQGELFPRKSMMGVEWLHWDPLFVEVLTLLGKADIDPAWSPEGSSEGSNLHVLMIVVKHIISRESQPFEDIVDLLEVMMTDSSLDCKNTDGEGRTILHALVDGKKLPLLPECAENLLKIVTLIIERNFSLADVQDNLQQTPLHTFLACVLQAYPSEVTQDDKEMRATLRAIQSQISVTKDDTKLQREWLEQPKLFVDVLKSLKSNKNIVMKNCEGKTALEIFYSNAHKWKEEPDMYNEVFDCLKSSTNIDNVSLHGVTALHGQNTQTYV